MSIDESDGLLLWSDLVEKGDRSYDLIFHDIGSMKMRSDVLPRVLSWIKSTGTIIVDDIHKWGYWIKARQAINASDLSIKSLHRYTLDRDGRFAGIIYMHE